MTSHTDSERVLAARLAAQRLPGPPAAGAVEVTRHLLAVQAQAARAARLAIRVRSANGHSSDVDRALSEERSLIVTWVNRGTLHLLAAEDEPWLHALTAPRLRTANDRRLHQEGVSQTAAEHGVTAITTALADRGPLTRADLRAVVDRADVPTAGQALVHVLLRAPLSMASSSAARSPTANTPLFSPPTGWDPGRRSSAAERWPSSPADI